MKYTLYLYIILGLITLTACDNNEADDQNLSDQPQAEMKSLYPSDSLVYHAETNPKGEEGYTQTLRLVYHSDSSFWFKIAFENMMAGGKVEGLAKDTYGGSGMDTFTYNDINYPARKYHYEDKDFHYYILINQQDSTLAKLNIESDIATDAIPLQIVMERVSPSYR